MLISTAPQSIICLLAPAAEVASFSSKKFHPPSFIKFEADNDEDDYNGLPPSVYDEGRGGRRAVKTLTE